MNDVSFLHKPNEKKRIETKRFDGCIKRNLFNFITPNLFVWILFFILNCLTPYFVDDISMRLSVLNSDNFFQLLNEHYQTTNGRIVVHAIAYFFLSVDKVFFNICNSFCYIAIVNLIYILSENKVNSEYSVCKFLTINILMWIIVPAYGQTMIWLDGACNYLWGMVIILLFILPYHLKTAFSVNTDFPIIIMFVMGVLAGNCNENTSGGCLLMVIAYIIAYYHKNKTLNVGFISGAIGNIAGIIITLCSPGNRIRLTKYADNILWYERIGKCLNEFISKFGLVFFIILLLGLIVYLKSRDSLSNILNALIIALIGIATVMALVFAPFIVDRALFGASIYIIISLMCIIGQIRVQFITNNQLLLCAALFIIILVGYIYSFPETYKTSRFLNTRYEIIGALKENGVNDIYVPSINSLSLDKHNFFFYSYEPISEADFWCNRSINLLYNADSIIGVDIDFHYEIDSNGLLRIGNISDLRLDDYCNMQSQLY